MIKKILLTTPLCIILLAFNAVGMDPSYEIEVRTNVKNRDGWKYDGMTVHAMGNNVMLHANLPVNQGPQITTMKATARPASVQISVFGIHESFPKRMPASGSVVFPTPRPFPEYNSTSYTLDSEDENWENWTVGYTGG